MYTRAVALIRYTGALSRFIKVLHKVLFNTNQRSVSGTGALIRYVLEPSAVIKVLQKVLERLSSGYQWRADLGLQLAVCPHAVDKGGYGSHDLRSSTLINI